MILPLRHVYFMFSLQASSRRYRMYVNVSFVELLFFGTGQPTIAEL